MYSILAKIGLGFLTKVNKKVWVIAGIVLVAGYALWNYTSMKDTISDLTQKTQRQQTALSQQNQALSEKDRTINNLENEIQERERISENRSQTIDNIKRENREMKNEIQQIENKCLDSDLPDDIKRMFSATNDAD